MRYYPSRGVAYESHLAPPAHLVGLRVAALDALLGAKGTGEDASQTDQPVVVVSAVALSEKVPDPQLRPRSFTLRVGELLDLDECAAELVSAGYERVEQVEERGQFALRGGLLDVFPATEERAVRVDMFDVEIESLRWFSTFTQRSLGEVEEVEIAPAAELAIEHRELAEIAAEQLGSSVHAGDGEGSERPDIAELLPVERFGALLDLVGGETELMVAAEEDLEPVLGDHWSDVCAAFGDEDAHHLYVSPQSIRSTLGQRTRIWLSALSSDQEIQLRAQSADTAARSLGEAEPELERLVRSGYRTVVAFPRRGEGERAAYNLGRMKATWLAEEVDAGRSSIGDQPLEPSLRFAEASLREGFVAPQLKLAVFPEHRLLRRRRAERSSIGGRGREGAGRGGDWMPARPRRGALRSFAELRSGDIVVHEDHGVARFAGFDTRTVANVTRDYLYLEYQGDDRVYVPTDQLAKISRYVGAGGDRIHPPGRASIEQAGRHALGDDEGARAAGRAGAGGRAAQPVRRAQAAQRARIRAGLRLAAGVRGALPVHRDARPARGDRAGQGRHGSAAADGPADLRRRRLRQDRGCAARRLQGRRRGQAGADARADHDPRPAALRHVRRAAGRLSVHARARLAVSHPR